MTWMSDQEAPPPAPPWVRWFAIAIIVLFAIVVIVHVAGGGMGRHMP